MNTERLEILMNQEIDGANSPAESRELDDALRQDPGARRKFAELKEALGFFDQVELLDPPPGLRERIMRATEEVAAPPAPSWRHGLRAWLRPVFRPIPVGSFALGVAVCLLFMVTVGDRMGAVDPQADLLQGMAGQDRDTLAMAPAVVRSLDHGPLRGRLVLSEHGPGLKLAVEIVEAPEYQVLVTWGSGLACAGFEGPGGGTTGLRVSGDAVAFAPTVRGRYEILFDRTQKPWSPIKIQIHHEGELVAEYNLATGSVRHDEKN